MRVPVKKGLSLKWGLIAIMALCWVVPVAVILFYSSYTISNNVQGRIRDTIVASVDSAFQQTEDKFLSIMDKSRASSYDDTIQNAYDRYQSDGDDIVLSDTVSTYLLQQYGYDSAINAAFLFFTEDPDTTIYHASNRAYAGQYNRLQNYKNNIHSRILNVYPSLSTGIGFLQGEEGLYMVRNIVDRDFNPYAVIVMECNKEELFQGIRSIVWLKEASLRIDGIPFAVVIPVDSVTLGSTNETMSQNTTMHLTASVLPDNATSPGVTWVSSDIEVATVDQTGIVTAVGLGKATITATADGVSGTCTVAIVENPVESVNGETGTTAHQNTPPISTDTAGEDAALTVVPWDSGNPADLAERGDGIWYDTSNGNYTIQHSDSLSSHTLTLSVVSESASLIGEFPDVRRTLPLIGLAAILLFLFAVWAYSHYISRPMDALVDAAGRMEAGERGYLVRYSPKSREFKYLTNRFNSMSTQLAYQFERSYQEQLALQDARVMALRSQISPHFLNNTLEVIGWEARMAKDGKICRMIEALSMMLTAAIARGGNTRGNMEQELAYADAYLYILSVRLRERLTIHKEIEPETRKALVPCLILQPIVENAIEHGIAKQDKGELVLRSRLEGDTLVLEVENDGKLTEKDRQAIARLLSWDPYQDQDTGETQESIGIRNVNRRLKLLYGEEGGLTISEVKPGRVLARILIPHVEFDTD
jgi:sensor histidine kinase YesM/uncharacterized protein YjdB